MSSATPIRPAATRVSNVTDALAADRLGVPAVVFFVMSAATPLTVVAGVITLAYAITGRLGLPLAFLLIGALLAIFGVGYVAMSRHVANAGAFYAYVSQGLGRPVGVGMAWVALVAYNLLQTGLYGVIGAAASPLLELWFGISLPWWVIALAAWAIVAVLGLQQVDINGKVLAVRNRQVQVPVAIRAVGLVDNVRAWSWDPAEDRKQADDTARVEKHRHHEVARGVGGGAPGFVQMGEACPASRVPLVRLAAAQQRLTTQSRDAEVAG